MQNRRMPQTFCQMCIREITLTQHPEYWCWRFFPGRMKILGTFVTCIAVGRMKLREWGWAVKCTRWRSCLASNSFLELIPWKWSLCQRSFSIACTPHSAHHWLCWDYQLEWRTMSIAALKIETNDAMELTAIFRHFNSFWNFESLKLFKQFFIKTIFNRIKEFWLK